jgi:hypothetical protein
MMNMRRWLMAAAAITVSCSGGNNQDGEAETGSVQVAITNAPADVACLKLSVSGSRTVKKNFDLTPGLSTTFTLDRLPVGIVTVDAGGFTQKCSDVLADTVPAFVSEAPVTVRIDPKDIVSIVLKLIRNGRLVVGVDFEPSTQPYLTPTVPGIVIKSLITAGESVNKKPDGVTPYRMVGIPDGLGAYDNGDGTFTLLANHEIPTPNGIVRAHGGTSAFVSKWTIRKADLTVLKGEDLIQRVLLWDPTSMSYQPGAGPALNFSRFCSADLAPVSAFFDAASGAGYNGRFLFNGEETNNNGRGFAHGLDGTSWDLPAIGKMAWENSVAHPGTGAKTVVAGLDDSTPGQVYIYVGTKTTMGSPIEMAGLTNGNLFGVKVTGFATEPSATGIPSGTDFTLVDLGNVTNVTGDAIEAASNMASVTRFNRPEDGHWDAAHPNDLYFVTTNSFTAPSRLWRLRFTDINNPTAGGKLDMLLDGSEGQKMFDNITLDKKGHVYLQEDVGNQDHIGKVWRYDIATDTIVMVAQHNLALFTPGAAQFLTRDEESSGIIDASDVIGPGWFLLDVQAHFASPDAELFEGGQLLAMFDPAAQ